MEEKKSYEHAKHYVIECKMLRYMKPHEKAVSTV